MGVPFVLHTLPVIPAATRAACHSYIHCRVEAVLKGCGAALVWVSHDPGQPGRVGGRVLNLPLGNESGVCVAGGGTRGGYRAGGHAEDSRAAGLGRGE